MVPESFVSQKSILTPLQIEVLKGKTRSKSGPKASLVIFNRSINGNNN